MKKSEYHTLLAPVVADYRTRPYSFWLPYLFGEPIVLDVRAHDGTECCVEINADWDDKPDSDIRAIFSIDDGGWRAFVPATDSFIIASDGTFVGE
jgi:hypothetical protein